VGVPEPDVDPSDERSLVLMSLPALARYAVVARATASACASLENFSLDDLGDIRLLVNELFYGLTSAGRGPIELRLSPADGRLAVEMSIERRPENAGWDETNVELLKNVADVVAEHSRFEATPQRLSFRASIRPID
jgi:anti-sigma regulatory factor (Ser/Thr protein kinase)